MNPSIALRSPNLGQPALARWHRSEDVTFRIVVAGSAANLDVAELLRSRLFLASLRVTRSIYQECTYPPPLLDDHRPLPERARHRLIPLEIRAAEPARSSPWHRSPICSMDYVLIQPDPHRFYPYAYEMTVAVPRRYAHCLAPRSLYNLVDLVPGERCDVKFHAVYLHASDWRDFTIAQACDLHVAWRNDFIPERLAAVGCPISEDRYVNFNEHLRQFIAYANRAHAAGELDLIIANGDIIDYIYENGALRPGYAWDYPGASDRYKLGNFEYFHDLVIARAPASLPGGSGIRVGEELEVPLFTALGNHDYRLNEYPLTFQLEADLWVIPFGSSRWNKYKVFGLNEAEAVAFEGGLWSHKDDIAGFFVQPLERPPDEPLPRGYALRINPDANYVVSLGRNRLVMLDTQSDEGIVTTEGSYLFQSGSQADFIRGHPDSLGFDAAQLDLLSGALRDAEGAVILACHAPPVNLQGHHNTPHHLMRECEHATLDTDDRTALLFDIARNRADGRAVYWAVQNTLRTLCIARVERRGVTPGLYTTEEERKKGRGTGQWLDLRVTAGDVVRGGQRYAVGSKPFRVGSFGGADRFVGDMQVGDYVAVYRGTPDRFDSFYWDWKRIDLPWLAGRFSASDCGSWSLASGAFFKYGQRDPYMGEGVGHAGFERLVRLLLGQEVPGKAVDLVLSGHTHQSIEFRIAWVAGKIGYAHDYYLDNTLHGLSAREFWKQPRNPDAWAWPRFDPATVPDYPEPLSATQNPSDWWRRHRPLIVQTASLGVNPGGKDRRPTPGASVLLLRVRDDVIADTRRVLIDEMKKAADQRRPAEVSSLIALDIA